MFLWVLKLYVLYRYIRLTTRRYGLLYVAMRNKAKPRHAAIGRGVARHMGLHGAVTGWNLPSGELVLALQSERELVNA